MTASRPCLQRRSPALDAGSRPPGRSPAFCRNVAASRTKLGKLSWRRRAQPCLWIVASALSIHGTGRLYSCDTDPKFWSATAACSLAWLWCRSPNSNWGPTHYECVALPAELLRRRGLKYRLRPLFARMPGSTTLLEQPLELAQASLSGSGGVSVPGSKGGCAQGRDRRAHAPVESPARSEPRRRLLAQARDRARGIGSGGSGSAGERPYLRAIECRARSVG